VAALRAGLPNLGWVEGRNIHVEFRWAEGDYGQLPVAEELVRLNVDILVSHGAAGALAAKKATSTIPIVITAVGDMVALGLVSSLSRPGGNITGLSLFAAELTAKRLELIKEAVPSLTKVAILVNPGQCRDPIRAPRGRGDCDGFEYRIASIRGAPAKRFWTRLRCHGRSADRRGGRP